MRQTECFPPTWRVSGVGQRFGARGAAKVRAHRGDCVERVAFTEHEQALVRQKLEAVWKFGNQAQLDRRRRVVGHVGDERPQRCGRLIGDGGNPRAGARSENRDGKFPAMPVRRFRVRSWPLRPLLAALERGDRESLHRHRVRRTTNRAQPAPNAPVVVFDHRGQREPVSLSARDERSRGRRVEIQLLQGTRARQYSGRRRRNGYRARTARGRRSSGRGR